jgi:hypothetical protein
MSPTPVHPPKIYNKGVVDEDGLVSKFEDLVATPVHPAKVRQS